MIRTTPTKVPGVCGGPLPVVRCYSTNIDLMKELWEEKGCCNLKLKSQNLRDQASRLEKNQGTLMETSVMGQTVIDESVLDSTHSAYNIDDNIISSEKA